MKSARNKEWAIRSPSSTTLPGTFLQYPAGTILLHVRRQIRQEVMPMLHDMSTFCVRSYQIREPMLRFLGQETYMAIRSISDMNIDVLSMLLEKLSLLCERNGA
jgi:hypothetical protein